MALNATSEADTAILAPADKSTSIPLNEISRITKALTALSASVAVSALPSRSPTILPPPETTISPVNAKVPVPLAKASRILSNPTTASASTVPTMNCLVASL